MPPGYSPGLLASAHDVSDGGLVVAIAESCLTGKNGPIGATVKVDLGSLRRDSTYFGETQSRVVVSVAPDKLAALEKLAADFGVPYTVLGKPVTITLQWTMLSRCR